MSLSATLAYGTTSANVKVLLVRDSDGLAWSATMSAYAAFPATVDLPACCVAAAQTGTTGVYVAAATTGDDSAHTVYWFDAASPAWPNWIAVGAAGGGDLTSILGTAITESTAGAWAFAFNNLMQVSFDSAPGLLIASDLRQMMGTALTETATGQLANTFKASFDQASGLVQVRPTQSLSTKIIVPDSTASDQVGLVQGNYLPQGTYNGKTWYQCATSLHCIWFDGSSWLLGYGPFAPGMSSFISSGGEEGSYVPGGIDPGTGITAIQASLIILDAPTDNSIQADAAAAIAASLAAEHGVAGKDDVIGPLATIQSTIAAIGIQPITIVSPIITDGDTPSLTLVKGDDYNATDAHQIQFTAAGWPSLAAPTTVTLRVMRADTLNTVFHATGVVTGTTTQTLTFTLTHTQTNKLQSDPNGTLQLFEVVATFEDASVRTLIRGVCRVIGAVRW